ncbi:hypothetical protein [Halorubrum sp. JWXQ-INN 858]|nr:hypothetical protein [Halorubrum sp. JWXQ-INN 858]
MPDCNRCGSFVTSNFTRVFGNNESEVYGCHHCMAHANLIDGEAAEPTG